MSAFGKTVDEHLAYLRDGYENEHGITVDYRTGQKKIDGVKRRFYPLLYMTEEYYKILKTIKGGDI